MATTLGIVTLKTEVDQTGINKGLKQSKTAADHFNEALGIGAAAAAALAAREIKRFADDSIKEFQSFNKGMSEVFTLMPDMSAAATAEMSKQALQLGHDIGRLPDEIVPALYQSISAGVPATNVFDFLQTANQAALGGVTDLKTAVDGLSSVVNAYGSDAMSAAQASDLMFTAVKLGKTNFEELSRYLYQVVPTASGLGVQFGNVTAAMAAMTSQGVPTRVAATQLRQAMIELSKDGSETAALFQQLSGKTFREFIASGGNLQGALQLLEQHAADTNVGINDLFGSVEAGSAALVLTGKGTQTFTNDLIAMNDAAGASEAAAAIMAGSLEYMQMKADAATAALKVQTGEALEPAQRGWLGLKTSVADYFAQDIAKRNQLVKTGELLQAQGLSADGLSKAMGLVSGSYIQWRGLMEDADTMALRTDAVLKLVAAGHELTADAIEQEIHNTQIIDRDTGNLVAKYQALYGAQIDAAGAIEATGDAIVTTDEQTGAYEVTAEQVAKAVKERQAKAFEEAAKAAEELAKKEAELAARSGDLAAQALKSDDGLGFFNETLDELGTHMVRSGGLTAQQTADLERMQTAYDKAAQTVRDYELGVKGANLSDEDRAKKIEEQAAIMATLEQNMQPLLGVSGELTAVTQGLTVNQDAVAQALMSAADAAGYDAETMLGLGIAYGTVSEEQAEFILKQIAIQQEAEYLIGIMREQGLTFDDVKSRMDRFIAGLDGTAQSAATASQDVDTLGQKLLGLPAEVNPKVSVHVSGLESLQRAKDLMNSVGGGAGTSVTMGAAGAIAPELASGTAGWERVPGPVGAPNPIIVHGGEMMNVRPYGQGIDGGMSVNGPLIGQVVQQPGESTDAFAQRVVKLASDARLLRESGAY